MGERKIQDGGEKGRMREMIKREKVRDNGEKKLEIMDTERES